MTYVIVKREGAENAIVHVEDKLAAEKVIQDVTDGLTQLLNPLYLTISKVEDDVIVRYAGQQISTIEVREDDEVDILPTNEQ